MVVVGVDQVLEDTRQRLSRDSRSTRCHSLPLLPLQRLSIQFLWIVTWIYNIKSRALLGGLS